MTDLVVAVLMAGSVGIALVSFLFGLMAFLDWRCQRCLEREPDNQFCCE